ncbi:MAG TPA: hypothetical protein VG148_12775, partial [Pyrinomonadaceae bacterium]|nr:hypothetical protein [Pyrinomonadaceae bacterium]
MAGLIRVDRENIWSAAGWVFEHVMRLAREHLPRDSTRILELMAEAETGLNYFSLEELSPEERATFRAALEEAYRKERAEQGRSFGDPEFYA